MRRSLGWVGIVVGFIAGLIPVHGRVFGSDVQCGPAAVAIFRGGKTAALCRPQALSYVLIGGVLFLAGCIAVAGAEPADGGPRGPRATRSDYLLAAAIVIVMGLFIAFAFHLAAGGAGRSGYTVTPP